MVSGHPVQVAAESSSKYSADGGVRVDTRSVNDLIQDCPMCGPFERHPDGRVARELRIAGRELATQSATERVLAILAAAPDAAEITSELIAPTGSRMRADARGSASVGVSRSEAS